MTIGERDARPSYSCSSTRCRAFALLMNAAENVVEFTVPDAPNNKWQLAVSSDPDQKIRAGLHLIVRDVSFTLLRSRVPQRRKRKT